MEREGSRLTFPIFRLQIAMPEMARYPKQNGKGSAETLPGGEIPSRASIHRVSSKSLKRANPAHLAASNRLR
jgi:hypothetical protein